MEIILVMKDYDELLDLKNKVESVYGREKSVHFRRQKMQQLMQKADILMCATLKWF